MRPAQRLFHPSPTKHCEWASRCLLPWLQYLKTPSEVHLWVFIDWLWQRALVLDTPTLYMTMVAAWEVLAPKGSRGASRNQLGARILLCTHVALSVSRLLAEKSAKRPGRWFQHAWRALPECHRFGIENGSASWFFDLLKWSCFDCSAEGMACVYLYFGHAGTYVGKANLHRTLAKSPRLGVPDRLVEHSVALHFPSSRDSSIARYKILRQSVGSVCFMPLLPFPSE